ncbi:unnamed protein product [Amoebophrya sp. A25]|nr:unnamed protein product [Amoebophrya sp. A25]|eukprot:GSA25T00007480001.1
MYPLHTTVLLVSPVFQHNFLYPLQSLRTVGIPLDEDSVGIHLVFELIFLVLINHNHPCL